MAAADHRKTIAAYLSEQTYAAYLAGDRNPLFIWQAYWIARRFGVPIPAGVLEYFDRCAERLEAVTETEGIAAALGLAQRGGGDSKVTQAHTTRRHLDVLNRLLGLQDRPSAADIRESVRGTPLRVRKAVEALLRDTVDVRDVTSLQQQVGEEFGLKPPTVEGLRLRYLPVKKRSRKH
jgi:hypothetical protein